MGKEQSRSRDLGMGRRSIGLQTFLGYSGIYYMLDRWIYICMQWIPSLLSVPAGSMHVLQPSGSTLGCLCRCCWAVNTWVNSSYVRSSPSHSFSQRGMGFLFRGSSGCPPVGGQPEFPNEEKIPRSRWPWKGDWGGVFMRACGIQIARTKILLVDALGQVRAKPEKSTRASLLMQIYQL